MLNLCNSKLFAIFSALNFCKRFNSEVLLTPNSGPCKSGFHPMNAVVPSNCKNFKYCHEVIARDGSKKIRFTSVSIHELSLICVSGHLEKSRVQSDWLNEERPSIKVRKKGVQGGRARNESRS